MDWMSLRRTRYMNSAVDVALVNEAMYYAAGCIWRQSVPPPRAPPVKQSESSYLTWNILFLFYRNCLKTCCLQTVRMGRTSLQLWPIFTEIGH